MNIRSAAGGVRSLGRGVNDLRPVSPSNITTGHHYAFSFFDDVLEKHRVEYGQLSVLKDKHGCDLIETLRGISPSPVGAI